MTAANIWSANKFIKEPAGDGGCPRIPTLKSRNEAGEEITTNNNEDKAKLLAKTFFPPSPPIPADQNLPDYPEPLPNPLQITMDQVTRHIVKLSPYKAHGPDGIPNIALQRCMDLISERLTRIFRAIITLNTYYEPWKEFTTIVLRKPSKPTTRFPRPTD